MTTQLEFSPDPRSENTFLRDPSDVKVKLRLTAAVNSTVTVPAGVSKVIFSSEQHYWVGIDEVPVLPTLSTESASTGELDPIGYQVTAGQTINIVSRLDSDFCVTFYY